MTVMAQAGVDLAALAAPVPLPHGTWMFKLHHGGKPEGQATIADYCAVDEHHRDPVWVGRAPRPAGTCCELGCGMTPWTGMLSMPATAALILRLTKL